MPIPVLFGLLVPLHRILKSAVRDRKARKQAEKQEAEILRLLKGGENVQAILAFLSGKKTYATGIAGLLIGLASLFGMSLPGVPVVGHDAALQMIVTALAAIFLRNGIAK